MRVALFTETYIPEVNGVVAHVKTLKDGLEKLGHEVLVVAADKHCKHHYIQDGVLHCPSTEVKRFYGFGVAMPVSGKRMRLISEFGPDVIHIHHEFGIGLSGILSARAQKKPVVYTLHTMYDEYLFYIAPRRLVRAAKKFTHQYEKLIVKNSTVLTGPSNKVREYFKEIGIDREINIIPNSADLDAFNPDRITQEQKDAFRKRFELPENRMLICFVGRLGKEKSIDVLLDCFKTIRPEDGIHLVIIGDGPDREGLEEQTRSLGLWDRVTFTGMIKHENMPACFAACDAYVTASLSEMNSISMLEAMGTGLPILQRYDELNADQITTGVNGWHFKTAQEFADRLREIKAQSPEDLQQMKQRVIASVTDRGATDLAGYMLEIYEQAIARKAMERNKMSI